tara:strand:+ start:424558 stop:425730 length:1173 start_codon:yes stop_codon:yes gene_type:complete
MSNRVNQLKAEKKANRSRRLRVRAIVVCLMVIVAITVFIIWLSDRGRVDKAYAQGVNATVMLSSQMIDRVFGVDGLGGVETGPRGIRVYVQEHDAWVSIDEYPQGLPSHVVVLIHGLDEPGGIWDQLAPALAQDGHEVVRFDYANDQPIVRSSDSLAISLADLGSKGVHSVDFVCHSMGGLVARDVMTRKDGDGIVDLGVAVERYVTIGTPHGGSPWARLRAVAEIHEQVQRWASSDDLKMSRLLGFVNDGVGDAGVDLLPGSEFLVALNSRPLPRDVRVTCIVGRMTPEPRSGLGSLFADDVLNDLVGKGDADLIQGQVEKIASEFGDGVVPMSSAVLEGIEDVVILEANHRSMIRNVEIGELIREIGSLPASEAPEGIAIVLDRLRRD